jgi:hypothetical protein
MSANAFCHYYDDHRVADHGTDHRAQLIRELNGLGVNTEHQDYSFYVYGQP